MLAGAAGFVASFRQWTKLIVYVLGSALIPLFLLTYLIAQGALGAAFDDVILFTAQRYASIQSVPFGFVADNQNRPLVYLFPIVALLTLITCSQDWRACFKDRLFRLCIAFSIAGFISCFPRPDIAHIAFVTPLVCPLLTYCTKRIVVSWLPKFRYALAAVVFELGILPVFAFSGVVYAALRAELIATPRGSVIDWNDGTRQLLARIAVAPSSNRYFFYPYMPMWPFLTAREHVSKYDIFIPGYTTPSQYQEACISAMRSASWFVIARNWTDPNFLREVFPAIRNVEPPERKRFELAIESGFEFMARDGKYELRRRVKSLDETVCAGIAE